MRLIDADILFEKIKEYIVDPAMVISEHPDDVAQYNVGLLAAMETVEESCIVDPVKHGRWIRHNTYHGDDTSGFIDPDWRCSECGNQANVNVWSMYDLTDFCPHCGAKMDK